MRRLGEFTTKDSDGRRYRWTIKYEPMAKAWILKDYDGYIRLMDTTWKASVPRINAVLENYGMIERVS